MRSSASARLNLIALAVVACTFLAACSSDDGGGGDEAGIDASGGSTTTTRAAAGDFPCDAWLAVTDVGDDAASIDAAAAALETVRDVDGMDEVDVDAIEGYLVVAGDLIEEYGSEANIPFESLPPEQIAAISDGADETGALAATNPVSLAAHDACDGADDPRYNLPCGAVSSFASVIETVTGGAAPPPIDEEAQMRLDAAPTGSSYATREIDEGTFEIAVLDDDEIAVSVYELVAVDGRWEQTDVRSCDQPPGGFEELG